MADRIITYRWGLFGLLVAVAGCFAHFFRIDVLPQGLHQDEVSIGYNAYLILHTGADEHGVRWPLFFEAFWEYKNPLYIYLLAGVYWLFGYSIWSTRVLNPICWVVGSLFLYALARRLFPDRFTRLYVAICLAFTPWVFTLTRISFELVVAYPLLGLHLYAVHRGFECESKKWAFVSGVALALTFYTESAFRLLTPLYILAVIICFAPREFRKMLSWFALGTLPPLIPYTVYASNNSENLIVEFVHKTYVYDPDATVLQTAGAFLSRYLEYLSPSFLLLSGDPNRLHFTGFCGEFLFTTVLLLLVAVVVILRNEPRTRFCLYLLSGVLVAPVAAALTSAHFHSLRPVAMSVYGIVLSCYGMQALRPNLARIAIVCTAAAATAFTIHYFVVYPAVSAIAYRNNGFNEVFNDALARTRGRVVLSDKNWIDYINLEFFGSVAGTHVPLVFGPRALLQPGDVFINSCDDRPAQRYGLDPFPCSDDP